MEQCRHGSVEHIQSDRHEGEIYGEVYGRCEDCGMYVKAYGVMEDDPHHLEAQGPWEIDPDADQPEDDDQLI